MTLPVRVNDLVEDNEAQVAAGALQIDGGEAWLGDRTLLRRNKAPRGNTLVVGVEKKLTYQLPAPLGRWIFAIIGITSTWLAASLVSIGKIVEIGLTSSTGSTCNKVMTWTLTCVFVACIAR